MIAVFSRRLPCRSLGGLLNGEGITAVFRLCASSARSGCAEPLCRQWFSQAAAKQVRAVLWQYWFTPLQKIGLPVIGGAVNFWLYTPTLELQPDGEIRVVNMPEVTGPKQ
jgi:hypothetical protein